MNTLKTFVTKRLAGPIFIIICLKGSFPMLTSKKTNSSKQTLHKSKYCEAHNFLINVQCLTTDSLKKVHWLFCAQIARFKINKLLTPKNVNVYNSTQYILKL